MTRADVPSKPKSCLGNRRAGKIFPDLLDLWDREPARAILSPLMSRPLTRTLEKHTVVIYGVRRG